MIALCTGHLQHTLSSLELFVDLLEIPDGKVGGFVIRRLAATWPNNFDDDQSAMRKRIKNLPSLSSASSFFC